MFKSRYLTFRVSPVRQGLTLHPNLGDCLEPSDCICTDGCSNCSGDCTGCTATCRGADSTGGIFVDRRGEVELMLDVQGLQALVKKVARADAGRRIAKGKKAAPRSAR